MEISLGAAMEFLIVKFAEDCELFIDRQSTDFVTNKPLQISPGHHLVSLSFPPANFTPPEIFVMANTTDQKPKTIEFQKV
jgi:hypothetical protein